MLSFRAKIAFYLEDVTTAIGLTVNLLILALILLSLGIYVAQTYPLSATWQMWLRQLDWGILSLFWGFMWLKPIPYPPLGKCGYVSLIGEF